MCVCVCVCYACMYVLTIVNKIHKTPDSLVVGGMSEYPSTGRSLCEQPNQDFLSRDTNTKYKH